MPSFATWSKEALASYANIISSGARMGWGENINKFSHLCARVSTFEVVDGGWYWEKVCVGVAEGCTGFMG